MTPGELFDEAKEPIFKVHHGRTYWSLAAVCVLASGLAAFFITKSQVESLEKRTEKIEATEANIATKADVKAVGDRVDQLYTILIERQEANPPTRSKHP